MDRNYGISGPDLSCKYERDLSHTVERPTFLFLTGAPAGMGTGDWCQKIARGLAWTASSEPPCNIPAPMSRGAAFSVIFF